VIDRASPRITWKPSLIATSTPTNLEPALGPPIGRAGFSSNELSGVEEISLSDDDLPPMVLRLAIPRCRAIDFQSVDRADGVLWQFASNGLIPSDAIPTMDGCQRLANQGHGAATIVRLSPDGNWSKTVKSRHSHAPSQLPKAATLAWKARNRLRMLGRMEMGTIVGACPTTSGPDDYRGVSG